MTTVADLSKLELAELHKMLREVQYREPRKFALLLNEFSPKLAQEAVPALLRKDVENEVRAKAPAGASEDWIQKQTQEIAKKVIDQINFKE
jgi:hypothetical protein